MLMKKMLILAMILGCVSSCKKVDSAIIKFSQNPLCFTKDGGEKNVEVTPLGIKLEAIYVKDANDEMDLAQFKRFYENPENITECTSIVCDWLKVSKVEDFSTRLLICVEANKTGESRTFYVHVTNSDSGKMLEVVQD